MTSFLQSMALPFLACLVLTGIHVYLGIHVLARKVIFVDLALATIAALGVVWGALLGWDIHQDVWVIKGFSLAFTFVGAAVFSLTRMRHERVPHEAIIGIAYAVALAAMILGSAKLPHGAEGVRDLQAGSILWVTTSTVASTAALYAVIGLFHFVFRRQFFAISLDPERAEADGLNVRQWDFLFYVSFGFVVTSSVSIAGVLLVFSYLVIPSVVAVLFAERVRARLAIGWTVGTLVSLCGVWISYEHDLPSGPVIVVCFGAFLVLAGCVYQIVHSQRRVRGAVRIAIGSAVAVALLAGSTLLRKREDLDLVHVLETGTKSERMVVLLRVEAQPQLWDEIAPAVPRLFESGEIDVERKLLELIAARKDTSQLATVHQLLRAPDDLLREQALKCVRTLASADSVAPLVAAAQGEQDDDLKVELAEAALELGSSAAVPQLFDVMEHGDAEQSRKDAWEHLTSHVDLPLPYQADASPPARAAQVAAMRAWWAQHGAATQLRHGAANGL
jgi:zinc/manganese transport system permease protein